LKGTKCLPEEEAKGAKKFRLHDPVHNFLSLFFTKGNCLSLKVTGQGLKECYFYIHRIIQAKEKTDPNATGLSVDAPQPYINQLPNMKCWTKLAREFPLAWISYLGGLRDVTVLVGPIPQLLNC
jgi:hypothetical protein